MKTFNLPLHEVPLWLWVSGFADFLLHTMGTPVPIPLGWISIAGLLLALVCSVFGNFSRWKGELVGLAKELRELSRTYPIPAAAYLACAALMALILFFGLRWALMPPHLPQEYDAINYQMGIPRQLLVRGNLGQIEWAVTDLWPMAMQWGMAPLSSAFSFQNKFPQFFFTLGAAAGLYRIPRQLFPNLEPRLFLTLPLFAIMGAHGVVTQIGSGMMDLPALYLLLLCICAVLSERWCVVAISLAVYAASKSFHPFQIAPLLLAGIALQVFGRARIPPRFFALFFLLSALLLARSTVFSWRTTGTPLFPFGACAFSQGQLCVGDGLTKTTAALLGTRYNYGNGRGLVAFAEHVWRVAVPTNGVNNEFDYPLGLPWLLLMVILPMALFQGRWRHPLFQLAIYFWALWWLNAHQSRWLYPTLAFGFLATVPQQLRAWKTLPVLVSVSMAFSLISQMHALSAELALSPREIQAQEEAKVEWEKDFTLRSLELLYVNKPALKHSEGAPVWILH